MNMKGLIKIDYGKLRLFRNAYYEYKAKLLAMLENKPYSYIAFK